MTSSSPEFHQLTLLVGGLKTSVDTMMRQWERQEDSATAGRKALHEKVEAVRQELGVQVASLGLRVDRLTHQVTLIEPSVVKLKDDVRDFEDDKLRDEGAKRLGKTLIAVGGTAITAVAGAVGYGVHELIVYLRH